MCCLLFVQLQKSAAEVIDDVGYVARSATLILTASLQVIEAVSGLNQLDQKITQATIDSITAIHRNSTTLYEQTLKVCVVSSFFLGCDFSANFIVCFFRCRSSLTKSPRPL